MRNRQRRWIFYWFLISVLQLVSSEEVNDSNASADLNINDDSTQRGMVMPKIDYDQWKPLGRGDPLKNDPTYDYVPPVLDRVHYWVDDPALRKPDPPVPGDNQKTEILLLGITSKKPAASTSQADSRRDTYDPYLKYVSGSNYSPNSNQRIARPSFFPSIPTSFFPSFFPPNKSKYTDRATFSKGSDQRVPYTMLMPPPVESPNSINALPDTASPVVTQQPTTIIYTTSSPSPITTLTPSSGSPSSSVTVQAANLVYQSSGLGNEKEFQGGNHIASSSPIVWEHPTTTTKHIPDYREELVYSPHLAPPESFINIDFAPTNYTNRPLVAADSNQNINYVTPPPLLNHQSKEVMFKGHVDDDKLDISNTYVKIGKPEAEVHSTGLGMANVDSIIQHPISIVPNMVMFPHMMKSPEMSSVPSKSIPPMTMFTIQEMQTMHPPPVTHTPVFMMNTNPIMNILDKEKSRPIVFKDLTTTSNSNKYVSNSPSMADGFMTAVTTTTEKMTTTSTTTEPPTTTTSFTTDPLFKHYKQPMEPMKGPLYLIIQGHSKVKTYGPSKQIGGVMVQESNEIYDDKYDKTDFKVKHLHGFQRQVVSDDSQRQARSGNLQTLKHVIQTGLGAIDFTGIDEVMKRSDEDFQEAELQVGYEVGDENGMATEVYHKGIVEEARKMKV